MLKRIISFFKGKEEDSLEISIPDIIDASQQEKTNYRTYTLEPLFREVISTINSKRQEVEKLCVVLENATLKNQKITLRERQFMEGNRESYVKHVRILMRFEVPVNIDSISSSYSEFLKSVEVFGQQTMRPRQILSHFFEHETEDVHLAVFGIKKEFDRLLAIIEDTKYIAMITLEAHLLKFSNMQSKKHELNEKIKSEEDTIRDLKFEVEKLKSQETSELNSFEYKSSLELQQKLKQLISSVKIKEEMIIDRFSSVSRALKKYERAAMDDKECLSLLVSSPPKALLAFEAEKIAAVLGNIKFFVENSTSSFSDEKEKIKILRGLSELLEPNWLIVSRKTLLEEVNSKKIVEDSLNSNLSSSRLKSLQESKIIVEKKLSDHISLLQSLKHELESLDEKSLRSQISSDYGIIIQRHIKII